MEIRRFQRLSIIGFVFLMFALVQCNQETKSSNSFADSETLSEINQIEILEKASTMDIGELAAFYRDNPYDFLRDAILSSLPLSDANLDALFELEGLFSFDIVINGAIKSVRIEAQRARCLYYYNNLDTILDDFKVFVSDSILTSVISPFIIDNVIDSIISDPLPEETDQIDFKSNKLINSMERRIDDILIKEFRDFLDNEWQWRQENIGKLRIEYDDSKMTIDSYKLTNIVYKNSYIYPDLYSISELQNSTDWVSWTLTGVGFAVNFVPEVGPVLGLIADAANAGWDIYKINADIANIQQYLQNVCGQIVNDLQSTTTIKADFLVNQIKNDLKRKLKI
ncbi:MAG: hypothetical protein IKB95_09050 [Bacteroidales bacterium]|nr:hypothetical protein [Bacteroidales bacterium]